MVLACAREYAPRHGVMQGMKIDNEKIKSFAPLEWAPFRGVSAIFDNPAPSVDRDGEYETLGCDTSDANLGLYAAFEIATRQRVGVVHMMETYRFCPLPP